MLISHDCSLERHESNSPLQSITTKCHVTGIPRLTTCCLITLDNNNQKNVVFLLLQTNSILRICWFRTETQNIPRMSGFFLVFHSLTIASLESHHLTHRDMGQIAGQLSNLVQQPDKNDNNVDGNVKQFCFSQQVMVIHG